MKSGLEDRNNSLIRPFQRRPIEEVSMKSGLEDRNNFVGVVGSELLGESQ